MGARAELRRLRCPACGWQRLCGVEEMLRRLRALGMLRREAQPTPAMVLTLLQHQLPCLSCDRCQRNGLLLEEVDDDFDDWGTGRLCETCGKPLAAERLRLYPDARRCAACEQIDLHAAGTDFCPRCGGRLLAKPGRGSGVARYKLTCRDCGYQGR